MRLEYACAVLSPRRGCQEEGDLLTGEATPHEESAGLTPDLQVRQDGDCGGTEMAASGTARRRRHWRQGVGGGGWGAAEAAQAAEEGAHGDCGCGVVGVVSRWISQQRSR